MGTTHTTDMLRRALDRRTRTTRCGWSGAGEPGGHVWCAPACGACGAWIPGAWDPGGWAGACMAGGPNTGGAAGGTDAVLGLGASAACAVGLAGG